MKRLDQKAFNKGVDDVLMFKALRWEIFKLLSIFGWWICPEPQKSDLKKKMGID